MNSMSSFCGNSSLWTDEELSASGPNFTDCFRNIVPVFIPVVWLILGMPFYINNIIKRQRQQIPLTPLSIVKTVLCFVGAFLWLADIGVNRSLGYRCDSFTDPPLVYYVCAVFQLLAVIYVATVTQVNRHRGVITSWMLWIFWLLSFFINIIPLVWNITNQPKCINSIFHYVFFAVILVQLVLYSFTDNLFKDEYEHIGKMECPETYSSVVSKILFWWYNPVVTLCYKKKITKEDLWDNLPCLKAEPVVAEIQASWRGQENRSTLDSRQFAEKPTMNGLFKTGYYEIGKDSVNLQKYDHCQMTNGHLNSSKPVIESNPSLNGTNCKQEPSFLKCVVKLYGYEWLRACFIQILSDTAMLLQPLILALIVEEVQITDNYTWYSVVLAILLFLLCQLQLVLYLHAEQLTLRLALKIKTALMGMIYKKTFRIKSSEKKTYTAGEIMTLVSVDCQRIQDAFQFTQQLSSFCIVIVVGLYELWKPMGISFLGCLVVILLIFFLNSIFGKLLQDYFEDIFMYKGSRIKIFNEVINGIKLIKMYTWEPFFLTKIKDIRRKEIDVLKKISKVTITNLLCVDHSPFFMNLFMLLIFTFVSHQPYTAKNAFLALSIINILKFPLNVIPFTLGGIAQASVSIRRIGKFLQSPEIDNYKCHGDSPPNSEFAITFSNGKFTWDRGCNQVALSGLNTKIRHGKLVAVVGLVGSGKSSLLSSILGEMEKLEGEVHVQGSVSYVSQEPWIQNLTIRDNILYGHEFVDRKYRKVIKNCCLRTDFKILPGGDETELGERGINVSGGQKQRINLARAVYCDSDIYLMDDPLSAVDSHVGKDLFDKVIGPHGMLKNKTRIFVTHGVQWLPKVDEIIVMDNGKISEHGTYERLVSNNGPFSRFLMQYLVDEDTSEDGDDTEFQQIKDEMFERVIVTSDGGMSDYITSDCVMSDDENKTQRSKSRRTLARQNSRKLKRQLSKDCGSPEKLESQTAKPSKKDGVLVQDETSEKGSVKLAVILTYIKSMGVLITIMAFIFLCVYQGLGIYSNIWITYWTSNLYLLNVSNWNTDFYYEEKTYYLGFYALIGILQGICFILFQGFIVNGFIHGTNRFHSKVLSSILRSPMSFFDTTPTGRIINRFSGDIDILDDRFPRICNFFIISLSTLIATMIVIVMKTPLVMVVIAPVAVLYVVIIKFYLPTSRQLKRTEAVTRSLLLSHYSETINGTSVIRAYNSEERFIDEVYKRLDLNSSFYFAANTGMGWIGMRIQTFGNLVVLAAALFAVLSTSLSGADAGLSLTYALQIIVSMNAVVQTVSILQMDIISMERVDEYSKLQPEATWIGNKRPVDDWPANGEIEFLNYKTCYREGLDLVLRGVSCNIKPGEKIGVVGRTGAGKSSLTMSLYRLIERVDGCIKIDGLDIAAIGLHDLRSKISILPQDPVIFSESLRTNLDPSSKFTDAQIWRALEYSNLKSFITSQYADLMSEVGESGRDLSVGQRQLLCLTRTLLHKTKILLLDEATAAVDMDTDKIIQQTIKSHFSECTVLSIAHRINTVIDYDRIMVMDDGIIAEFDTPETLLQNKAGVFYSLAKEANLI
ncbi:ATP-binding cassette sub-family C member 3-like [Mytilus trossulus]|uniref:ATP-binding cassette sub-family C member 3-like n=1 Tax=Mytilus trossulus TaxID=6551 RepID=UPI003006D3A7